jgi:hypothetical protein
MSNVEWSQSIVAGLISGAISGLLVGSLFHYFASKQLREEAAKLRKLTTIVIRGMEEADWIEVNRDAQGNITGIVFERKSAMGAKTELQATPTITGRPPDADHGESG